MTSTQHEFQNVLVTGGAGYVGSVLTDRLIRSGYHVRVFDILRFGGSSIVPCFGNGNFELVRGDIRDRKAVCAAAEGMDAVIHLAAIVGFPACLKDPKLSREVNVGGTRNVVAAAGRKIPILFASTGSAYGSVPGKVCTEDSPLQPISHYGRQKVEAERIMRRSTRFVIFRFATAFGVSPRMRLDLLPNDFSYRAVKERTLVVYEKNFMRTFIHVRDMARLFQFALEHYGRFDKGVYNAGDSSMNFSKEQICQLVKEQIDYYLHFAEVGKDQDQRDYRVSYARLNARGFRTSVSMREGIAELVKAAKAIDTPSPYYNA